MVVRSELIKLSQPQVLHVDIERKERNIFLVALASHALADPSSCVPAPLTSLACFRLCTQHVDVLPTRADLLAHADAVQRLVEI